MACSLSFTLNGQAVTLDGISPNTTLLEFLRGHRLTGAKEGCAEGDCGACSVIVVDQDTTGKPVYRSVNSCLMPVCLVAGREVISVEGVGREAELHSVQRCMVEGHGSQCGYCTPGFICSMFEGYHRDGALTPEDWDDQLAGNLCRCTGYRSIREAAALACAEKTHHGDHDTFARKLATASSPATALEYHAAGESFHRPGSLAEVFQLLEATPNARLIAGATELGLDITKRFQRFPALISVEAVSELRAIRNTDTEWQVGAAATLTEIEEALSLEFPAMRDMLRVFGSRQIRNRASMGGNLVTASPIGDCAPVLLALDASVVLASATGERRMPLDQFFVAYRKTALHPGEILKTILIPRVATAPDCARKMGWMKVSKRREMDISTVAACFTVDMDHQRRISHARLAYGGVAPMPARARNAEKFLVGRNWNPETLQKVRTVLAGEFTPISDVRGSAEFRNGLVVGLFEKFFHEQSNSQPKTGCELDPVALHAGATAASIPHESAIKHVTGDAMYVDDLTAGRDMLEVWPVCSPHARARILKRDVAAARRMPGIQAVLLAEDIPGVNDVGTKGDEPLFAIQDVSFHGQLVALVVGESQEICRAAAEQVRVDYEPLPPLLSLREAVEQGCFHNAPNFIRRGDCESALTAAPHTITGEIELGGQEHFYLETHAAWAEPGEDGSMFVASSTQHPSEVQQVVAHVLHRPSNRVVVQCPRLGGGFGGKETQAATPAALAALAAHHLGRAVRVRFNRDQDMMLTGHRHPFLARFTVGFDAAGLLRAARIHLWSNGGWAQDLSQAVTDRALFHLDNAYYVPAVEFRGQVAKTNLSSNTAFRGFGGPQGMLVMEEILDRMARHLNLPVERVRERNLYRGNGESNTTHYGQEIGDNRLQLIWQSLKESAALEGRRTEIASWNAAHPHTKRGIAITPVKFGISFTVTHLNQAGALVLIYQDGTVQLNHGGTEMGQGLHTNVSMIAARELGVKLANIRVMPTSTDKVPNTSATAASAGTDLNGAAVRNACETLRLRLAPFAQALLTAALARTDQPLPGAAGSPASLIFRDGFVFEPAQPNTKVPFAEVVKQAYLARVSLSATGYYATPGIHWDRAAGTGRPFHYFANGAAVAEVAVDGFTGMHRVLRVDILHDVGDSVNEGVNRGQIEGGFIQGMGWLTTEELKWDDQGRLLTHSPDTYKIPAIGDTPRVFNVAFLPNATQKEVIHGSKAVGEPPLMLALSVREAIRDAVAAFGEPGGQVALDSPATCEAIWKAIQRRWGTRGADVAARAPDTA